VRDWRPACRRSVQARRATPRSLRHVALEASVATHRDPATVSWQRGQLMLSPTYDTGRGKETGFPVESPDLSPD
jgi:hypothetical protein